MFKIVALSCTHRPTPSLTDDCLQAAAEGFTRQIPDAEIVPIRLIDYNLKLCVGEDECLNTGICPIPDDFYRIVEKSKDAKGMILSMPVYGGNVPAVLKIFMERLKSFMNSPQRPFGDLPVCTIVHSRTMLTEAAMGALSPWYGRLKNRNVVSVCFTNADPDISQTKILDLCSLAGEQLALSYNRHSVSRNEAAKCTYG